MRLCEHFVAGTPARTAAELVGVNKNMAVLFYHRRREIVAARIEDESPLQGEIEIDESYFGGRRKGKRGRGAAGKVSVFGILKRGGRVCTKILPNTSRAVLMPIIKAKIVLDSVVYTDTYMTYDNLDVSGFRHHGSIIAGLRGSQRQPHQRHRELLDQAKRHLRKYNGIPRHHFHLFLKECEWRFNYGPPAKLFVTLKSWIKRANR